MKFLDGYEFPAVAAWGTKRGKDVFFTIGVMDRPKDINHELYDIANAWQFVTPGLIFYSIEHKNEYCCYSIYRTILDATSVPGYYAISLFIPIIRRLDGRLINELLELISKTYWINYISISTKRNSIARDVEEDVEVFKKIIRKKEYLLSHAYFEASAIGEEQCFVKYENDVKLVSIFENHNIPQLRHYKRIFLVKAQDEGLSPVRNLKEIVLGPIEKTFRLRILIYDEETDELLDNCKLSATHEKLKISFQSVIVNGIYEFPEFVNGNFEINIQKKGYKENVISNQRLKNFIQEYYGDGIQPVINYKIILQRQRPREISPVRKHQYLYVVSGVIIIAFITYFIGVSTNSTTKKSTIEVLGPAVSDTTPHTNITDNKHDVSTNVQGSPPQDTKPFTSTTDSKQTVSVNVPESPQKDTKPATSTIDNKQDENANVSRSPPASIKSDSSITQDIVRQEYFKKVTEFCALKCTNCSKEYDILFHQIRTEKALSDESRKELKDSLKVCHPSQK